MSSSRFLLVAFVCAACLSSVISFRAPVASFGTGTRLSVTKGKISAPALSPFSFLRHRTGVVSLRASSTGNPVVVVAGATGRVGRLVVQELLKKRENSTLPEVAVRALVRDESKAQTILPTAASNLEIVKCDLGNNDELTKACAAASAVIWCATGFSDSSSIIDKLAALFKLKVMPKQSIDIAALTAIGLAMKGSSAPDLGGPRVIMCSSAGVTRPTWSDAKKKRYEGAADIPIVRLNPFGILDVKREGEQALRDTGASYCIVRPCGLNDKWPAGRPVLSQGDLAVGRMNRADVAALLAALLPEPAAAGLTFESIGLPGYPPPASYALQLSRLRKDPSAAGAAAAGAAAAPPAGGDGVSAELDAVYAVLQQLVPGETMQPNQLAMGQTYEQLDRGEQGRLGPRGAEAPPIVRSG